MSRRKKFEELSETQKAAFHNMDDHNLFVLYNALRTVVRAGACKAKLEICAHCPVKGMTVRKVGYGGPMACSLIELEAASRGRYVVLSLLEETGCDQCGRMMKPGEQYIQVPQYGYRTLNFCMNCVEKSQI
jgi:hypothetical protein